MTAEQAGVIRVPERLTVETGEGLLGEMIAAVEDHDSLCVDLANVIAVDTAGLQLLLVLKQSLESRGGSCALEGAPSLLVERARLLGLDGWLELA